MSQQKVTVSFAGIPGTGKSLLMSLLLQDLNDMGIPYQKTDEDSVDVGPLTSAQKEWIAQETRRP